MIGPPPAAWHGFSAQSALSYVYAPLARAFDLNGLGPKHLLDARSGRGRGPRQLCARRASSGRSRGGSSGGSGGSLETWTVRLLKEALLERQLSRTGRKQDLLDRLQTALDIEKMTVTKLKAQLAEQGLETKGLKAELVKRLTFSLLSRSRRKQPEAAATLAPRSLRASELERLSSSGSWFPGRVRVVMAFGVFVETSSGWGMIPVEELPQEFTTQRRVNPSAFSLDEPVEVKVLQVHVDSGCLLLSMKVKRGSAVL
ncbi:unnamed protein product [Symbiodinium sp. KB8]|nr:unnamed protein product [Symbiodinium sp. KB8]